MELKPRAYEKIMQLINKGVEIHNPLTLDIGDEVAVERISGKDVTIHPGCRIYGAKTVIGLDVVDHRLDVSRAVGAAHTVNAERENPAEAVRELTDGALVDLVIEAVGKEETINYSLDLVRQNGDMLLFGIPKRSAFVFEYEKFLRKLLRTTSSAFTQQEPGLKSFRLGVDLIAQGRLDVMPLISHCLPLTEAPTAFSLAQTKEDNAVKVLVDCWLGT